MAVHQPGAWVILLECNREVAPARERSSITARWVLDIKASVRTVERERILREDPKIMPMEMDWVC
jgi:hypothetical protein